MHHFRIKTYENALYLTVTLKNLSVYSWLTRYTLDEFPYHSPHFQMFFNQYFSFISSITYKAAILKIIRQISTSRSEPNVTRGIRPHIPRYPRLNLKRAREPSWLTARTSGLPVVHALIFTAARTKRKGLPSVEEPREAPRNSAALRNGRPHSPGLHAKFNRNAPRARTHMRYCSALTLYPLARYFNSIMPGANEALRGFI